MVSDMGDREGMGTLLHPKLSLSNRQDTEEDSRML